MRRCPGSATYLLIIFMIHFRFYKNKKTILNDDVPPEKYVKTLCFDIPVSIGTGDTMIKI